MPYAILEPDVHIYNSRIICGIYSHVNFSYGVVN